MATIGDLVLVYQEEQPAFFARIEDISADSKPGWYQVKFVVLQVPVAEHVWILREGYISGETFTMNGVRIRIEKVSEALGPGRETLPPKSRSDKQDATADHKVISIFDRKRH